MYNQTAPIDGRAFDLTHLPPLIERPRHGAQVAIGLIDGPVAIDRREFTESSIHGISAAWSAACRRTDDVVCQHGTCVARLLLAIYPECILRIRPIYRSLMETTPGQLAAAIEECVEAGVEVINLSLSLARPSTRPHPPLAAALDLALRRGVLVVAATGNQGTLGSSAITRHPAVIPVAACDLGGRPLEVSNFGRSTALRGLSAPGEIEDLSDPHQPPQIRRGTSISAPFVTGTIALLRSLFPQASASEVRGALLHGRRRPGVVPPLLDAWGAYRTLSNPFRS